MEDGPIGTSGQFVKVDVDRVNRIDKDLVPTPGLGMVEETAMDMIGRRENATLEDDVLVCRILFYSFSCKCG